VLGRWRIRHDKPPQLRALGAALGNEALGIDLSKPLEQKTFAWIQAALPTSGAVFRDQLWFGRACRLRPPLPACRSHALTSIATSIEPEVFWLTKRGGDGKIDWYGVKRATDWHTDSTFEDTLPCFALLHAREVPSEKAAPCRRHAAAYDALPDHRNSAVRPTGLPALDGPRGEKLYGADKGVTDKTYEEVQWPRSPGIRSADVRSCSSICIRMGSSHEAGRSVAAHRGARRSRDPGALRYYHRWRVGDVLIWDERATMHRARRLPARPPDHVAHDRVRGLSGERQTACIAA